MKKKNLIISTALSVLVLCVYPQAGDLDPTFAGGAGVTNTDAGGLNAGTGIAIQDDKKIVTVGQGGTLEVAIVRYNFDGTPDSTFGTDGIVITPISSVSGASDVTIQADGKIVAVGNALGQGGMTNFLVVRYNPNGSLDTSFNGTGIVLTPVGGGNSVARAVAIQKDGKIIAVGQSGTTEFATVRYNSDGSIDTSFGDTGIITMPLGASGSNARDVVIQPDGKIVVVGDKSNTLSDTDIVLVRYNTDGSLDTSFGSAATGIVIIDLTPGVGITSIDAANSVALQEDGKIVAAGQFTFMGTNSFVVVRLNKHGILDASFNSAGLTPGIVIGPLGVARTVAIQIDGKIIAAGSSITNNFMLIRLMPNGLADATFGTNGIVLMPQGSTSNQVLDIAIQQDGRIIASGQSPTFNFAVARYLNSTLTIIKKASSEFPCPGQNITYTISATNFGAGGGTVNGIEIQDVLPEELIFRSVQTSGDDASSFDAATGIWSIPCLRIGETATLKIKARVGQCAGNQVICNTAITSYSSVDNVTDSSLFEELGLSTTEIFSTTECVSTLPVVHENVNVIANRTDCGVDDLNMTLCNLMNKVCDIENELSVVQKQDNTIIFKLNCLANFFSTTDCLF